jgi:tRNA nucleotidyltransferase (CCA-adding enzyme)
MKEYKMRINPYAANPVEIFVNASCATFDMVTTDLSKYRLNDNIWAAGRKGLLKEVSGEQLWDVFKDAMSGPNPRNFFDFLFANDVLHLSFPEVYRMRGAIESQKWHPEGNAYEHTMLVLQRAAHHDFGFETRLACLVHDFGKALTPLDKMPKHHGHDEAGMQPTTDFLYRFGALEAENLARPMRLMCKYHMRMHDLKNLRNITLVRMFNSLGIENVATLMQLAVCDAQGRLGSEGEAVEGLAMFSLSFQAYKSVSMDDIMKTNRNLDIDAANKKLDDMRASLIGEVRGKK